MDIGRSSEAAKRSLENLAEYLQEKQNGFPKESNTPDEDEIWSTVTDIFAGKIGTGFEPKQREDIINEGQSRYEKQIPPGYEDRKKGEEESFGDLFLWFQVIEKAKEAKKPILFVTDDRKDDWWWKSHGKTIGPRHELVDELQREAGVPFHMYQPFRFMEEARRLLGLDVSDEAIDEAQALDSIEEDSEEASESELLDAVAAPLASGQKPVLGEISVRTADQAPTGPLWTDYEELLRNNSLLRETLGNVNSPEAVEARRILKSSRDLKQAQELLNSSRDLEQAQKLLNSPGVREAQRQLNDPSVRDALRQLNGPAVRQAMDAMRNLRRLGR